MRCIGARWWGTSRDIGSRAGGDRGSARAQRCWGRRAGGHAPAGWATRYLPPDPGPPPGESSKYRCPGGGYPPKAGGWPPVRRPVREKVAWATRYLPPDPGPPQRSSRAPRASAAPERSRSPEKKAVIKNPKLEEMAMTRRGNVVA